VRKLLEVREMNGNHGCGSNEETQKITLQTEDGVKLECSVIDIFGVEGYEHEYIALLPENSSEEVLIYRYIEYKDGDFGLFNLESDEEYADVEDAFLEGIDFDDDAEDYDVEIDDEFIYEDDE
jgi:uncharacterized protein YrzB (UPF0473 family)